MQNILAIWQREMKSYFVSPIAYVVLTVFLFLSGLFFFRKSHGSRSVHDDAGSDGPGRTAD